jgi:hypothetical protein
MSKASGVIFVLILSLSMTLLVQAQDATSIGYGETINGEITDDEFEIPYTFSGTAGDVVLVEMRRANSDSGLYNAAVVVLDPSGSLIADSADYIAYEGAEGIVALQLPEDGDYTVLATRDSGRSGDETGEYILKLFQLDVLGKKPIQGEVTNETQDQYYAVLADGSFTVKYSVSSSNYAPLVDVNYVNEDGYFESAGSLSGLRLDAGTVQIFAEAGQLYVVAIVADDLDYLFDEDVQVAYELSVSSVE